MSIINNNITPITLTDDPNADPTAASTAPSDPPVHETTKNWQIMVLQSMQYVSDVLSDQEYGDALLYSHDVNEEDKMATAWQNWWPGALTKYKDSTSTISIYQTEQSNSLTGENTAVQKQQSRIDSDENQSQQFLQMFDALDKIGTNTAKIISS